MPKLLTCLGLTPLEEHSGLWVSCSDLEKQPFLKGFQSRMLPAGGRKHSYSFQYQNPQMHELAIDVDRELTFPWKTCLPTSEIKQKLF